MKRMVYIIISVAAIGILAAITAGCAINKPNESSEKAITGISLSQHHMNFHYYYSFYIRNDNGKILFDADVRFDEEPYEIILEGCEVDSKTFEKALSISEKHSIDDYVIKHKKVNLPFEAQDKTEKKTTLYFADGTEKSADTGKDYEQELYDFFKSLALEYQNSAVTAKN